MNRIVKSPTLFEALLPVVFLIILLGINVTIYRSDSSYGANQIALLISAAVAVVIALRLGYKWKELQEGIINSIYASLTAILILLMIGALAGTWLLSGIVPAMIYYGLKILNPSIFLFAACVVCSIVSLATGSSWSTVATVGIALLGIGKTLGFNEALVAGSIISGAYFGDKMSPLSDTTNLAPAVAGTDLFTHIRYMTLTTFPSILITLLIYLAIGIFRSANHSLYDVQAVLTAIDAKFNVSPVLFLVPALVIYMILKKMPALPALFIGSVAGALMAVIIQPHIVNEISGIHDNYLRSAYVAVHNAAFGTIQITAGNEIVDKLLSTRGMAGMLNTVWLITCAMVFGGAMETAGLLKRITQAVIQMVHSTGSLIAATVGTCIFFNITASDQYLAIIVPGRMFARAFSDRKLAPQNLSRSLEDSGTVTSVLVPWNTCGATQASVLGVATFAYAPFCFFNIISPLMSILFGYLNIRIATLSEEALFTYNRNNPK
jgi:NhaC family Na+:H+ antiporter